MFSKQLIEYTESTFKESKINILTKTMVKEVCNSNQWRCNLRFYHVDLQVKDKSVVLQMPDKSIQEVPCGMVVWAGVSHFKVVALNLAHLSIKG